MMNRLSLHPTAFFLQKVDCDALWGRGFAGLFQDRQTQTYPSGKSGRNS